MSSKIYGGFFLKKRLLSLALGTMMVLSTLAGCGSKDGGSAAVNTKPEEQGVVDQRYLTFTAGTKSLRADLKDIIRMFLQMLR